MPRLGAESSQNAAASAPSAARPNDAAVSRFPESFFAATVVIIATIRVIQTHATFSRQPGSDWGSSDWMIDYAGGFVRRGLGGASLSFLMHITGVGFFLLWTVIALAVLAVLCFSLLARSSRLHGPALWRFALLFNPLLLIAYCDSGMFLRKDLLSVLATLLNVVLAERALTRANRGAARLAQALPLLVFAMLASLILALLHEGVFLFIWFPINLAVLAWTLSRLRFGRRSAFLLALTFSPALVATAASVRWHGSAQAAQLICRSWRTSLPLDCSPGPGFPPSFAALSWSVRHGIVIATQYAWTFPLWLAVFAVAGGVLIVSIRALMPQARLEHLLAFLVLPLLASLPLFLIGMDWGRWLSLLAISSMTFMLSDPLRPALFQCLPSFVTDAYRASLAPRVEHACLILRRWAEHHPRFAGAALFMLPVPPLPLWWASILLSPPVILLGFLYHWFR